MFVGRNTDGKITIAVSGFWEGVAAEEIADDDAELLSFLNPPPNENYTIPKTLPWIRMTDAEATKVVAAMPAQGARFNAIYNAAGNLDTADDLYKNLQAFLSAVLTPARATELLARE